MSDEKEAKAKNRKINRMTKAQAAAAVEKAAVTGDTDSRYVRACKAVVAGK